MIQNKLDAIDKRLDSIDVTMNAVRLDLNHHIEQTNILREEVKPIRNSHQQIIGVLKFLGFLGVLASLAEGLKRIFF